MSLFNENTLKQKHRFKYWEPVCSSEQVQRI